MLYKHLRKTFEKTERKLMSMWILAAIIKTISVTMLLTNKSLVNLSTKWAVKSQLNS